jgi:formate dehydrogenase gamma subunit
MRMQNSDGEEAMMQPTCLRACVFLLFFLLAFAGWSVPASAAPAIKDSACMDCHADKELFKTNSSGKAISLYVDEAKLRASIHKTNSCVSCHSDVSSDHPDDGLALKTVNCGICHERHAGSYQASVHGIALAGGMEGAPVCADCHGSHNVVPPASSESPLHYLKLAETCGACHDQAAADVAKSVHGKALAAGYREAPTCTDCHSEHRIAGLKGNTPLKISADVCSNCHASERINTKFNLPDDRVKTFFNSYHGLAAQYGSATAANCGSCHGWHKVLPSSDPASSIHPANLVQTCGSCHPGASENFAQSKVHIDADGEAQASDMGGKINWWVRRVYLVLIFGTIGFMVAHNLLLFIKKVRASHRKKDAVIVRMDGPQRLQHALLAISFIILAVSGFALKFPDSWLGAMTGSNEVVRSWTHRLAGVVMLLTGSYHCYYLIRRKEGRRLVKDLLPVPKDAADLAQNTKYLIGMSEKKALIGRFGYAEKMEYWAVVWGTILMGATGLMIWFKIPVTQVLPRWALEVATAIHFYEAVLACLAIVVWHFYHVMFDPDVYPINLAAWHGRVSPHWQEEEHPLEKVAEVENPGENEVPRVSRKG